MKLINTVLLLVIAVALLYLSVISTFYLTSEKTAQASNTAGSSNDDEPSQKADNEEPPQKADNEEPLQKADNEDFKKQSVIDISKFVDADELLALHKQQFYSRVGNLPQNNQRVYDDKIADIIKILKREISGHEPRLPSGLSHVGMITNRIEGTIYYGYVDGRNYALSIPEKLKKYYITDEADHNIVGIDGYFKFIKNTTGRNGLGGVANVEHLDASQEWVSFLHNKDDWKNSDSEYSWINNAKNLDEIDLLSKLTKIPIDKLKDIINEYSKIGANIAGEYIGFQPISEFQLICVTPRTAEIHSTITGKSLQTVQIPSNDKIVGFDKFVAVTENGEAFLFNGTKFESLRLDLPEFRPAKVSDIMVRQVGPSSYSAVIIFNNNKATYGHNINSYQGIHSGNGKWYDELFLSSGNVYLPAFSFSNRNTPKDTLLIDHQKNITCVEYNEQFYVVGTEDGDVLIYTRSEPVKLFKHFEFDTHKISSLCIVGDYILAGSHDWSVMVWDINTGKMINRHWPGEGRVTAIKHFATESGEKDYIVIEQTGQRNNLQIVSLAEIIK